MDSWASEELTGEPERDLFERPIFLPFWGLVGLFNHYNLPIQAGSAEPTRVLVALLVFSYLVVIIVLVNLMIAAMSETYQRVREDSALYYLFERARLIQEFKRKGALPPPLNALTLLCFDLPRAVAFVSRTCRCEGLADALSRLIGDVGNEGISRDGFRLVPGPSQQQLFARRMRLALRRCLKRQTMEQDAHIDHQVAELREQLVQLRTEARSNFEHLSVLQVASREATSGMLTARSALTSRQGTHRRRSSVHSLAHLDGGLMARAQQRNAAVPDDNSPGPQAVPPVPAPPPYEQQRRRKPSRSSSPAATDALRQECSSATQIASSPKLLTPLASVPAPASGAAEAPEGLTERAERHAGTSGSEKARPERRRQAERTPKLQKAKPKPKPPKPPPRRRASFDPTMTIISACGDESFTKSTKASGSGDATPTAGQVSTSTSPLGEFEA
jgi:hypothetical protein